MKIRDRIKEFRRVKASEILPNPRNWRTHPKAQKDALKGLLAEIGFAGAVLARETPNGLMLIDGHLRTETATDSEIPVLVLDVDEDEAHKILLTFDPVSTMANADAIALDALLRDVQTSNEAVANMLTQIAEEAGCIFKGDGQTKETIETESDREQKSEEEYLESSVRQIMLVFDTKQYDLVVEALAEICEKEGLSSNTDAVLHLLHTNGYQVNTRQEE